MSSSSRRARRRKRKQGLIRSIYIDRFSNQAVDFIWLEFNVPAPIRDLRVSRDILPPSGNLSVLIKTDAGKGEAYVSKYFPGITYRMSKPDPMRGTELC